MTKTIILAGIIVGLILLGGTMHENAFAAVDMFIKMSDIDGEAKDKNHKDEIDVLAWSWGMTQSDSSHTGGAGKVIVQDLSFTKYVDKATPKIYESIANGEHIAEVKLTVSDDRYSGKEPYLTYTLKNVLISSVSTGGSGSEDRLTENVSLNFEHIKVTYQPFDNKKKSDNPVEFTWDVATNTG